MEKMGVGKTINQAIVPNTRRNWRNKQSDFSLVNEYEADNNILVYHFDFGLNKEEGFRYGC
jgi:tRNA A37 threonylcarbamoyladenosine biosynthesis protein TsaE